MLDKIFTILAVIILIVILLIGKKGIEDGRIKFVEPKNDTVIVENTTTNSIIEKTNKIPNNIVK